MNILHTVDLYEPSVGGAQKVVKEISEGLVGMGHSVTIATSHIDKRRKKTINGVKIKEFSISGNKIVGINGEVDKYKDFLLKNKFDVMMTYAAQQWTSDITFELLDKISAKKVFVPCGFSALEYPKTEKYFAQMPTWMNNYDLNIFTSKEYQDYKFAKKNFVKKSIVIPNAASEKEFLKSPNLDILKDLSIPKSHKLIVLVGSHTGYKGHHEAIDMFKRSFIKNSTLLVIANDFGNGCKSDCERKSERYNLSSLRKLDKNKILIENLTRKQTIAAMFKADLFLFPSQLECSPLVMFESMAAGTPFMCTDVGNAKEIIRKSKSGILLPTKHDKRKKAHVRVGKSSNLLRKTIKDEKLLNKMGCNGRKYWKENNTWGIIAKKYETQYKKLLKSK